MVEFAGNYQAYETVNPEVFIKAASKEVTEEKVAALKNISMIFKIDNDNYSIISKIEDHVLHETKFTLGKSFEEDDGKALTNGVKDDDKLILTTKKGSEIIKRTFEFSESGVVLIHDLVGGTGKILCKRI